MIAERFGQRPRQSNGRIDLSIRMPDMAKRAAPTPTQDASFRRRAGMPWLWQMQAHVLIASANVLWKRYRQRSVRVIGRRSARFYAGDLQPWPAMMIDGFAMENLLKALLLAQGVQATQGSRLEQTLRTHNLTALCTRAGIVLNQGEEELLERIKRMMELGRYPVGADAAMDVALRLALPQDRNTMTGLLQRVDDQFKQTAPASVDDDLRRLGVKLKAISSEEHMRRIAMLHGQRPDGTRI
jgi:hypothetical protein